MALTLYHSVESTCAQKVRFVLSEKNLDWEERRLNLRRGDQFAPEYLKLNPKAVVPTLIDDGKVVRESTVIAEYIDDVFPDPPLKPADKYHRARMRLVVKAFDDEAHPAIGILTYAIVLRHQMNEIKTPEELEAHFQKITDPGRRQRQISVHEQGLKSPNAGTAVGMFKKVVELLDESLNGTDWLAGDAFTLADAAAIPYMVRADAIGLATLWRDKPNIQAWFQRAVGRGDNYELDEPWGSASFHAVVANHASAALPKLQKLL